MSSSSLISARDLTIRHGNGTVAVNSFSLDIAEQEFVGIVGPSGCGKTTFLDAIAGFVPVAEGELLFRGRTISGPNVREVGYLFQKDSLMPWRTALGNVCVALELRGVAKSERHDRAEAVLRRVGLAKALDHYPDQLSGGMRRRVQLAVLLAYDPEVILMDEPFGALDAQTRAIIEDDFLRLWWESRKTVLFVTHDLEEAICLCDRVVIVSAAPGRVKQVLAPGLPRPRTVEDAKFHPDFIPALRSLSSALKSEVGRTLDA